MKNYLQLIVILLLCLDFAMANTNPWKANPEYYLEPLSPILGSDNLSEILNSHSTPSEIYNQLLTQNNIKELQRNSIAYSQIVLNGMEKYCAQTELSTRKYDIHTKVHFAAVPVDPILISEKVNYEKVLNTVKKWNDLDLRTHNLRISQKLMLERETCAAVSNRIKETKEMVDSICAPLGKGFSGKCTRYTNKNLELFSPEASYPRTQFSINGFTRDFNLKLAKYENLDCDLEILYSALLQYHNEVVDSKKKSPNRFWKSLMKATTKKFEMIFLLSGLTRNLPSLDYLYGINPSKALLVEVYFWKIRQLMDKIDDIDKMAIYPINEYEKPEKVGLYHFYTAAYQTCSLLKAGYGSDMAVAGALAQKIAYKSDKFVGAMKNKSFIEMLRDLPKTLKEQGTLEAIGGGLDAAIWAEELCLPENKSKFTEHMSPLWLALKSLQFIL